MRASNSYFITLLSLAFYILINSFCYASEGEGQYLTSTNTTSNPSIACPIGNLAGCNKGTWQLNSAGKAIIADLEYPATYRICMNSPSRVQVLIHVDGVFLNSAMQPMNIYPAVTIEESANQPCAIVTGRKIFVHMDMRHKVDIAHGDYTRLEDTPSLKNLIPFYLSLDADEVNSALLLSTDTRTLHRLCKGFTSPKTDFARGASYIQTDRGYLFATLGNPKGEPIFDGNCVDFHAKQVYIWGAEQQAGGRTHGVFMY